MNIQPTLFRPIARIHTDFKEKFGIPRQSGRVPALTAKIVFLPEYRNREALREIESFSHLWLIFDFSAAHRGEWSPTVRPPRLGGNRRVGVFASRSPFRPNPVGLSSVRLLRVESTETEGDVLWVSGADLLDGTPIFDIKPYLPFTDCHPDAKGGYADGEKDHALTVHCPEEMLAPVPPEKREGLLACLREDPRPSYQKDPERLYRMHFDSVEVAFCVKDRELFVRSVEKAEDMTV